MTALSLLLGEPLVQRLGWTLIHTLWQGVVIAALLAVVLRLMRSAPASLRYIASCCAMGLILVAAGITFGLVEIAHPPIAVAAPAVSKGADRGLPFASPMPIPAPRIAESPQSIPQSPAPDELRWIVLTWAVGVLALSLWHIAGWLWLTQMRRGQRIGRWEPHLAKLMDRLGIRRTIRLIETARIDVPAVIGALRPVIVVPIGIFSGLSAQQVEAILAHELAHIRRHDYLVNLIQSAIETLMFYHPATWWISSQIRRERENCCDDIAAKICGDERAYAGALAALEARRGGLPLALNGAMAATGGSLLERVRRVLHLPPARRTSRMHSLAATALAIACVAVPLACVTVRGQQEKAGVKTGSTSSSTLQLETKITNNTSFTTAATQSSPVLPHDLEAKAEDYRTGPDDLLSISITDLVGPGVETVKTARVTETGMVSLPHLDPLKVTGLTAVEVAKAVQKVYQDAHLLANSQVSASVVEAKQRNFRLYGDQGRSGQYMITSTDFRLLDALGAADVRANRLGALHITRKEQGKERTLSIPCDELAAGEPKVNVVIRPGDTIIVSGAPKKFVKIVIGKETLLYEGKPIDLAALRKMLEQISDAERERTVLEVAAASPTVTVERFFNASAQLSALVKQYHLAYLSEAGIQPTTEPSSTRAEAGEYYISGVKRDGVYSLSGRKITLKQALMAAGGTEVESRLASVTVVRREGEHEKSVVQDLSLDELLNAKVADPYLSPGDMIVVKPDSFVAVMEVGALTKQRDDAATELEELKRKFGPNHPRVVETAETIKGLDARIAQRAGAWGKAATQSAATRP